MDSKGVARFLVVALITVQLVHVHGYSDAEVKALEELRSLATPFLTKDFTKADGFLIRFLRVKNLNVEAAKNSLFATLRWRKDNKMDNILEETYEIEKALPYTLNAIDKEGNPVGVLKMGLWDARRMVISGKTDDAIRVIYKILETALAKTRELSATAGKDITQLTLVADAAGYNLRQHGCLSCFRIYVELFIALETHYPYLLKNIVIINAPRLFDGIVELAKPVLNKNTKEALQIYGYNKEEWLGALLKLIPRDQLELALERKV